MIRRALHIPDGTSYPDAIRSVLRQLPCVPEFTFVDPRAHRYSTPYLVFHDADDPWADARDLAAAVGMEVRFDPYLHTVALAVPVEPLGRRLCRRVRWLGRIVRRAGGIFARPRAGAPDPAAEVLCDCC